MERFYKRKVDLQVEEHSQIAQTIKKVKVDTRRNVESKKNGSQEANLSSLESDPGLRKAIKDYPPNDQDEVRRRYILKGPCQPSNHVFPLTPFGKKNRRFNPKWFSDHRYWLEYSIDKDATFCLKALILKENSSAYYIHCFAHQLQLALVGVAKKHSHVTEFFSAVASIMNVVGASAKRSDILQEKQIARIAQALQNEEIESGRGLNQSTNLKRHGDTRWGSHYGTLLNLLTLYSSTIEVLEIIIDDVSSSEQRFDATNILLSMQSYGFAFTLHLMRNMLGISNELSQALQRKDQDIANAIALVRICKIRLQDMRENGWNSFINQVSAFCQSHNIDVPEMNDVFVPRGRSRRKTYETTNLHHYRVELYYSIIDMQLQELNGRFDEVNTALLLCIACLCPDNLFVAFEKEKLIQLADYYPKDFSPIDLMALDDQLQNYIVDMRSSVEFSEVKGIGNLSKKMVEIGRDKVYPLVYRLLTLSLILPVATATVERIFSGMHLVKTKLRNRIGDQWLNDSLVIYIEREIFEYVSTECVVQRFQHMKTRRGNL